MQPRNVILFFDTLRWTLFSRDCAMCKIGLEKCFAQFISVVTLFVIPSLIIPSPCLRLRLSSPPRKKRNACVTGTGSVVSNTVLTLINCRISYTNQLHVMNRVVNSCRCSTPCIARTLYVYTPAPNLRHHKFTPYGCRMTWGFFVRLLGFWQDRQFLN